MQRTVGRVVERHGERLFDRDIRNLAAIVIDNREAAVVAYVGNVGLERREDFGQSVDILQSRRSTGSILKPFLYAAMLQEGGLTPTILVPDTPVRFEGFRPANFDRRFRGAVPARTALAWSLNVPAVRELRDFGIPRFENRLRLWGMTTLDRSAEDYGLTLILGGVEGRLVEIVELYAKLAQLASGAAGGGREVRILRDDPEASSKMKKPWGGRAGEVIFEAVHREHGATIHWHLDERYVASTRIFHQVSMNPDPGEHRLILTDDEGRRLERKFQVVSPARRADR